MKKLLPYIKIARPDHWIKQFFIMPGFVLAVYLCGENIDTLLVARCILGLLFTSLIASANYVINEWLDGQYDKYHPTKKSRPVVTTDMKVQFVYLEYIILVILGLFGSYYINIQFLIVNAILLLMGFLYNVRPFRTKDIPVIDVLSESINNAIRFLLGWFIVTKLYFPPSSILIGYWMAGAFLMDIKRFAEFRMINNPEIAAKYRKSFGWYNEVRLLALGVFYAMLSNFLLGTFFVKYRIELIIVIPLLGAIFCYYLALAFREDSSVQKPEKLYKEKKLLALCIIFIIVFISLMYINMPVLSELLDTELIALGGW